MTVLVLALPILALFSRINPSQVIDSLTSTTALSALEISLQTSTLAALGSLLLGVPLAWVLSQSNNKATSFLRAFVLSPLVMPPTVAGIALLALFGRNGLLGSPIYDTTGQTIAFTTTAIVIAGIFVSLPFTILLAESAFTTIDKEQIMSAQADGASALQIFTKIAIPQARNGIANATLMSWARAFGEFGATLMFAGSIPEVTRTLPMQVYSSLETNPQIAYSLSAFMILIAVTITILMRKQLATALHN